MTVTISSVTIPVGTVPGHEDELCVKVWNWDNRWKSGILRDGEVEKAK